MKAQAIQNEAYQRYIEARDRYNKVLQAIKPGQVELSALVELTAGLPDAAPDVKAPQVAPSQVARYFAYSRSGRRENGGLAVHQMEASKQHIGGQQYAVSVTCTCPGFKNHGYCWASDEARAQAKDASRKSGTQGVWKNTL